MLKPYNNNIEQLPSKINGYKLYLNLTCILFFKQLIILTTGEIKEITE